MTTEKFSELYLFGTGGHATVALDVLLQNNSPEAIHVIARDKISLSIAVDKFPSIKFLTQMEFENKSFNQSGARFHVAIGSNDLRRQLVNVALKKGLKPLSISSPLAVVSSSAILGIGVFLGPGAHVGPRAKVGDYSIINTHANLEHDSEMGQFSHLAPGSCVCGSAKIGLGAVVGANSVVMEGAKLGDWSTLGAMSFLNYEHVEKNSTLVGIPARLVRGDRV